MSKPIIESCHKVILDTLLLDLPGVMEGSMFGYPAYYANGKLFACIYGGGVGLKVPEEVANRLVAEKRVVPFQPLGRPKMREWIQIDRAISKDYVEVTSLFRTAVEFVSQFHTGKGKKK